MKKDSKNNSQPVPGGIWVVVVFLLGGALWVNHLWNQSGSSEVKKVSQPTYHFENASQQQKEKAAAIVQKGLTVSKDAYAIKSEDHQNGWYVGAKIYGPGIEDGVEAVWLMSGDKDKPGLIFSAESFAESFSDVPHMNTTKAAVGHSRQINELRSYVGKNI